MSLYILNVALFLAGCIAFYKLLLVQETFFKLNRIILLACLVFSLSVPLIPVPQQFSFWQTELQSVEGRTPALNAGNIPAVSMTPTNKTAQSAALVESTGIKLSQVVTGLIWLYWAGVGAFGINFLVQIITLLYRSYSRPVIRDGRFRIVEVSGEQAPCSFGNSIFINPEKYDWETYNQILLHEKIHIRDGHSFDILFAELVLIFQWFNPFAWIYRKELENNLEFLTDQQLLEKSDVDQESYQLSLLKVSAPHFPLSLTTNYNQSLLKKRVNMMNAKKSSANTTWKYLFLIPLLTGFVCLLNKPISSSAALVSIEKSNTLSLGDIEMEGAWFATIEGNTIAIQFKNDGHDKNSSNSTFQIVEFKNLSREGSANFSLSRDAGTIRFTGKFDGLQGMGRYKFSEDSGFTSYLKKEGIWEVKDQDLMTLFMLNISRSYIEMLKSSGYTTPTKDDLIPLAALKVDEAYIQSLKKNGYNDLELQQLIPLKSLGIDDAYIKEIKKAGYPNVTTDQLITFKAQGIDAKYIADYKEFSENNAPDAKDMISGSQGNDENSDDDIIAFKALNVDANYIKSFKKAGYDNLTNSDLIAMKSLGIDADYISEISIMGLKNVTPSDVIALKSQNISKEYISSIQDQGYTVNAEDLIALKATGVTSAYIKSFRDMGYKDISLTDFPALKAHNITSNLIIEYKALGFSDVSLDDIIAAKATGTTPAFINEMRQKGHKLSSFEKYISLKSVIQ
jgi:hypothetical protein